MSVADPHPDARVEAAANVVNAVNAVTDVRFTGHLHGVGCDAFAPMLSWILEDKLDAAILVAIAARRAPQQRSDQLHTREPTRH